MMDTHECFECGADFTVELNPDSDLDLEVSYCPFCGTEIIKELDFNE